MTRPATHHDARRVSPRAWVDHLVEGRAGLSFPAFPPESIQRQFVGSAFADAMAEALRFYELIHQQTDSRWRLTGRTVANRFAGARGRYLDFGCGWGRFSRLFLRDFEEHLIVGVDIDPEIIEFCRSAGLPGEYSTIGPPPLPFESDSFRLITAYSVFSHLPPPLFEAWLHELGRVLVPGGLLALTVEPPRFLDFVDGLSPNSENRWHAGLARHKVDLGDHRRSVGRQGIAFLATGGGGVRTADVYGDTIVTRSYLNSLAQSFGDLVVYVDDPRRFWQAAAVIQKIGRVRARSR